eukprot:6187404-Pleurochrysis_carterae.AAC.1
MASHFVGFAHDDDDDDGDDDDDDDEDDDADSDFDFDKAFNIEAEGEEYGESDDSDSHDDCGECDGPPAEEKAVDDAAGAASCVYRQELGRPLLESDGESGDESVGCMALRDSNGFGI